MHLETLTRVDTNYQHVYLAPHLDDAALSCGGAIARQRAAGERVLVVTLCTAAPPATGPFSALAEEFHRFWQLGPAEVVAARLREEHVAMARLDADYYWAGLLDAIYRAPAAYTSRDTLFNTPAVADPLLPQLVALFGQLRQHLPNATCYAPLGVGSHVDHLLTYQAALQAAGAPLLFYEDFPYVAKHPDALAERIAATGRHFQPQIVAIDATLDTKLQAVHAYASQLVELFGSAEAMAATVRAYAAGLRSPTGEYAERVWRIVTG